MLFSFRRRRTAPQPATEKRPLPPAASNPTDIAELHLQHQDYNGQPVSVESLSHYIEPTEGNERFRVH